MRTTLVQSGPAAAGALRHSARHRAKAKLAVQRLDRYLLEVAVQVPDIGRPRFTHDAFVALRDSLRPGRLHCVSATREARHGADLYRQYRVEIDITQALARVYRPPRPFEFISLARQRKPAELSLVA